MKKNINVLFVLFKMKLSKNMAFRFNFFGAFFVDTSLFILQLLMFDAIYTQVSAIGGWERGEMIIFIGTFSLINALNMTVFFFGIYDIPRKIKTGELDHYLTKAINPLLRLSFESINIGSVPLIFASILIVIYGTTHLNVTINGTTVLAYSLMVMLMTLLWYDISIILRTISFFMLSASVLTQIEDCLLDLNMKIPGVVYKGSIKLIFYLILPYGIMSTFPTQILIKTLSPLGGLYGVFVVILFTIFMLWFWNYGLKHYKSASS